MSDLTKIILLYLLPMVIMIIFLIISKQNDAEIYIGVIIPLANVFIIFVILIVVAVKFFKYSFSKINKEIGDICTTISFYKKNPINLINFI